jgi:pimeloyl-ACP methyl ester carboxylesterase
MWGAERRIPVERAQIGGMTIEYEVGGAGEPVLFIHGALMADTFKPLLTQSVLTSRYQLIIMHRRGYAGSTHADRPVSIAEQAMDCHGLLQHLGVQSAHIVGHSSGAVIALQLALDAPRAVHTLSLLEPALHVGSNPQMMEVMRGIMQMCEEGNKAKAVETFVQGVAGPEFRRILDAVLPGCYEQAVNDADTFFRVELPSQMQWRFTQEEAARITQPVLAVLGAESHNFAPNVVKVHEQILAWLPQAEPFVLDGANHALQIMNAKGMAEGLARFFAIHPLGGK